MRVLGAGRSSVTVMLLAVLVACDGAAAPEAGPPPSRSPGTAAPLPDPYAGWLLPNVGQGPMLVAPIGRSGCPRGQIRVRQVVHLDGNDDDFLQRQRDVERRRRPGGCMLDHPTHDHWHFDAMAAYSLTVPGRQSRVAREKVSFCLRDNERVPGHPRVVRRSHFGDCTAKSPQGISPGWVDVYGADLDGQWLRLPPRIDGTRVRRLGRGCDLTPVEPVETKPPPVEEVAQQPSRNPVSEAGR